MWGGDRASCPELTQVNLNLVRERLQARGLGFLSHTGREITDQLPSAGGRQFCPGAALRIVKDYSARPTRKPQRTIVPRELTTFDFGLENTHQTEFTRAPIEERGRHLTQIKTISNDDVEGKPPRQ